MLLPAPTETRFWATGRQLEWLPVQVLTASLVLLWVAGLPRAWPAPVLSGILASAPPALALGCIIVPAARRFLKGGKASFLLLGCAVLMAQIGWVASSLGSWPGPEAGSVGYDGVILFSALGHLAGVACLARRKILHRPAGWLALGYGGIAAVAGMFLGAGHLPVFSSAGQGAILARSLVVGVAVALFGFAARQLWEAERRTPSAFLRWYAMGLVLLAIGLAGSALVSVGNSPLHWATRLAQAVGTLYLCVAVRTPQARSLPFDAWRTHPLLAAFRRSSALGLGLPYPLAALMVLAAFEARQLLTLWFGPGLPVYITVYPAVMAAAGLGGLGPGLLATILAGVLVDYRLLPPTGQLGIASTMDRLGLVLFLGMCLVISLGADFYRRYRLKAAAFDRETALRASQARLDAALASMMDAVCITDTEGRFLEFNDAFVRFHRFPSRAACPATLAESAGLMELFSVDGTPAAPDTWAAPRALRGETASNTEYTLRRKDTRETWVGSYSFGPIREKDGTIVGSVVVARDITEHKLAQQSVQAAHDRFNMALSCMTFGTLLVTEDGRVDFANQAFCDIFMLRETPVDLRLLSSQEMTARIRSVYVDPDRAMAHIDAIIARGQLVQDEEVAMTGERTFLRDFIPLRSGQQHHGRLWVHKDVTEHRRAEERLRELSQRLTYHVDHSPLAVIEWGSDMRLIRWSGEAERIFGWRAEEVLGKRMEEFRWIYQEDEPQVEAVSQELLSGANPRRNSVNRNYRKDGTVVHCEWYNSSLLDESGRLRSILSLVLDVTERTRLEARLKEEALRKDDFLAVLGHELRNPLVPIGNAMHLIRRAGQDRALVENACGIAEHQVAHISRLVDDLLDVSRIARGKVQLRNDDVDLVAIAARVAQDYGPVCAENGLDLELNLPSAQLRILADQERMVQVVGNLLQNAIKFTDPGGRIRLSVDLQDGRWARIQVQDNGAGIALEQLSSIFEPFMQRKETIGRTRGGLGLGLALVRGMVALHGGTIAAHSDGPGSGARFTVCLPLLQVLEGAEPAAAPAPMPATRGRRILVVEDLPDAALTLRLLLELSGHTVELAPDGTAALDKAASFAPEIIFCDIGLPGSLDGYDVARAIRAAPDGDKVHLIAMTGFGSPEARERTREAGFQRHLIKPVEPEALERIIADLE
ncbi:MAG: PAS domain S-box protein [Holophaga sp.]|nr:PAS domain S-box protein [Holophaga sp.]